MTSSSNSNEEEKYYLVVDFDNLFFDYRSVLVNFLGSISNAIENNLKSPWNFSLKDLNDEKNSESDSKNENLDSSKNRLNLDSHLLRLVINSILDCDVPKSDLVKESLSSCGLVLEMDEHSNNSRLKSMCETYSGSSFFSVSVKDGKVSTNKYKDLGNLTLKTLKSLPLEVFLLGWHKKGYLELFEKDGLGTTLGPDLDYYFSTLESVKYPQNFKLVLVTSFKDKAEQFLNLQGFSYEGPNNNCTLVDNLENLPKSELDNLVKCFKLVSSNKEFLDFTTEYLSTLTEATLKTKTKHVPGSSKPKQEKINLVTTLDPTTLSGTLGSYLVLKKPFKISAEVLRGVGRGNPLLGIPTANVLVPNLPFLLTGVYLAFAYLSGNSEVSEDTRLHSIVSVGFNPQFQGETHWIEAYLYHKFNKEFYGQTLHLEFYGYLRTDSKFNSLEHLVDAIQSDLHFHKLLFPLLDSK